MDRTVAFALALMFVCMPVLAKSDSEDNVQSDNFDSVSLPERLNTSGDNDLFVVGLPAGDVSCGELPIAEFVLSQSGLNPAADVLVKFSTPVTFESTPALQLLQLPSGWTCRGYGSPQLECSPIGDLAAGVYAFGVSLDPALEQCGTDAAITMKATASHMGNPLESSFDSVLVPIGEQSDELLLDLEALINPVVCGERATARVRLNNAGQLPATGVQLIFSTEADSGIDLVSTETAGWSCAPAGMGVWSCMAAWDVEAGESAEYLMSVVPKKNDCDSNIIVGVEVLQSSMDRVSENHFASIKFEVLKFGVDSDNDVVLDGVGNLHVDRELRPGGS